jgi:hypothetical protein
LYGLGLALFDALLFPLLALNLVIAGTVALVIRLPALRFGSKLEVLLLLGVIALSCLILSTLVVRSIWRWARRTPSLVSDMPGPRRWWKPVLVTLTWHGLLFVGTALFFVYFVPGYVKVFADLELELPGITRWSIRLTRALVSWGWLAYPVLLLVDGAVCLCLQRWAGRGLRVTWSLLVLLGCLFLVISTAATLYLPFSLLKDQAGRDPSADAATSRNHRVPSSAHVGSAGGSAMVCHRDGKAEYVVYYPGDFRSSGGTTHNTRSLLWYDDFNVYLASGTSFGYTRESTAPQRLRINGRGYLLLLGRVFLLHDDGTVEQFPLFPGLETAKDPDALGRLVAEPFTLSPPEMLRLGALGQAGAGALDLENGRVVAVPEALSALPLEDGSALQAWLRDQHLHLVVFREDNGWSVRALDAALGHLTRSDFDGVTPELLRAAPMTEGRLRFGWSEDLDPEHLFVEAGLRIAAPGEDTLAFRTLSGTTGVLLLGDSGAEPPILDVSYRRLMPSGPETKAAPSAKVASPPAVFPRARSTTLNHLNMPFTEALDRHHVPVP